MELNSSWSQYFVIKVTPLMSSPSLAEQSASEGPVPVQEQSCFSQALNTVHADYSCKLTENHSTCLPNAVFLVNLALSLKQHWQTHSQWK